MRRARMRSAGGQSFNRLIPNILTLLALCAGVTAMRYALEGAWERAVIAVLAAAPGRVKTVGAPPDTASPLHWTQPGHHVVVDHGGGWTTLYAHMAPGSVTVDAGATVVAGERIGTIGNSGDARFDHLHFEVQYHGAVVDPFSGTGPGIICGVSLASLWSDAAAEVLAYRPSGLLGHGFAGGLIRDGSAPAPAMPDKRGYCSGR